MTQDITSFAKVLPHLPSNLPVIKVRRKGKMGTHKDFIVRLNCIYQHSVLLTAICMPLILNIT